MFKKIGLLFIMLLTMGFTLHDVYISSMKMELIPTSGELQLTLQVFTDDLELVLQSQSGEEIQLNPDRQATNSLPKPKLYLNCFDCIFAHETNTITYVKNKSRESCC